MAQYWESQEQRWHERYIEAEKAVDKLENKIWEQASEVELLKAALRSIAKINNKRDCFSNQIDQIIVGILGDENV